MIKLDFWYKNKVKDVSEVTCYFYPNNGDYRGNMYIDGRVVGDFIATSSEEVTNTFGDIFRD